MIEIFEGNNQKEQFVSNYSNPFHSDKIERIELTIEKSLWDKNKVTYKSCICFSSGATNGYHRMEADSFVEIVKQTELFIKSI